MERILTGRVLISVLLVAVSASGCAAGRAFGKGESAARGGDLDVAVGHYRQAVTADPDNVRYRITLERTQVAASQMHLERARQYEEQQQLEAARGEYFLASDYDPTNRQAAAKVAALDRIIRERIEAARPKPQIDDLRERARAAAPEPVLNPTSREPLSVRFTNADIREVLDFVAAATGIDVAYDRDVTDRVVTVDFNGVTVEQMLTRLMTIAQLSYKVMDERGIFVFPDTAPKHALYDDHVVQTFHVSYLDPAEAAQMLTTIVRFPGMAVQPVLHPNGTTNTIIVRATRPVLDIVEKVLAQNDKPQAEIVIDVQILEVNRTRAKQYGLDLSEYAIGGALSPEVAPTPPSSGSTQPSGLTPSPPFNVNTISRGFNTADFYLAVPTALVRLLQADTSTKLVAKPQLRGAEGAKLSLRLGESIPVITTSYTPIATGGAGVNPLSSYNYRDVGVNIDMTPRVTLQDEIILDLTLENSSRGADVSVAGVNVPSFGQRTVTTRLRLRDGESNLLAGLLREDERKSLRGLVGVVSLPGIRSLFASNDSTASQTDIVMLLTPRIIRTRELTDADLVRINVGSQQSLGAGGGTGTAAGSVRDSQPAPAAATVPEPAPPAAPPPDPGTIVPPDRTSPLPGQPVAPAPPGNLNSPDDTPPATSPGIGLAQVTLTPAVTRFRVGEGPYAIPIAVLDATRLTEVTLVLNVDPALLAIDSVQEGSFMRSGGTSVSFRSQAMPGRVELTLTRGDETGASGTGLLATVLLQPMAPGTGAVTLTGSATGPGGTPMALQFGSLKLTVEP